MKGRKPIMEDEEEEVSREEVEEAINKLKRNKAVGQDEMQGEIIKYRGEKIRVEIWKIVNKVWMREGWPEEWKTLLIVPLLKKVWEIN